MPTSPVPTLSAASAPAAERERSPERPRWWRELAILGGVYLLYSLIRNAAPTRVALAQDNAHNILRLERALGIDIEHSVNSFVAATQLIAVPVNYYYATLHFIVTAAVLLWLYAARPGMFTRARQVLLVMTLVGLVGYWLFPLAPPRLTLGEGYIDTGQKYGTWGALASHAAKSVSNQYAAMPSMHVGWALWSGAAVLVCARRLLIRIVAAAYPVTTFLVVLAAGHHFVLDAVGAVVAFSIGLGAAYLMFRLFRSPDRAGESRPEPVPATA